MIGLGTAATQLDTSVNIAFPAITRGFGLAIGDIQWVVICLRADLRQPAAGARAHRRHRRSRAGFPDWPDLERGGVASCQLVAELRRDAGVSLPAGCRRGTGAELWRGAGDISLWRGAAQPGARHLYHDAGVRLDARSPAWRRLDGGLGLACGVPGSGFPSRSRRCCCCAACRYRRRARQAIASMFWEASR